MLEHITSHFGKLLKVDNFIMNMPKVKYTSICVEIDLLKPLILGFRAENVDDKVMVAILYERLLVFYYSCGIVGNGTNKCPLNGEANRSKMMLNAGEKGKQPIHLNEAGDRGEHTDKHGL